MSEAAPVAPPPADRPFSSSSNPVCPAGTFSRVGNEETRDGDSNSNVASQKHEHCVCPDSHICEGCEQGCTRDRPPLKKRCVSGFKPGCTSCRCRQRETNWGVVRPWGAMADLRNAPLCPNLLGSQNQQQGYTGEKEFVFTVSNGHTGTLFFGRQEIWERNFRKGTLDRGVHIAHEQTPDLEKLRKIVWEKDWCERGLDYVVREQLPYMLKVMHRKHTWFASGYQVGLGTLPALADYFGASARFVRLRRNRIDLALSFSKKGRGPCSDRCLKCLCPLDTHVRCLVPGEIWGQLNVFQRYLWVVDEVECQWQALVRSRKTLRTLELDWDQAILPKHVKRLAEFIGMDKAEYTGEAKKANQHQNVDDEAAKLARLEQARRDDAEYQKLMGLEGLCNTYHCMGPE